MKFVLDPESELAHAKLLVVDEGSMVSDHMASTTEDNMAEDNAEEENAVEDNVRSTKTLAEVRVDTGPADGGIE